MFVCVCLVENVCECVHCMYARMRVYVYLHMCVCGCVCTCWIAAHIPT